MLLQTNQPNSCLDVSRDFIACGTLDETVFIWKNLNPKPYLLLENHLMGVVDLQIDENETKLVVSCLDSMIRIWDLENTTKCTEIKCDPFENLKVRFLDSYNVLTAGEAGLVSIYHTETRDRITQIETDKIYYTTSLNVRQTDYESYTICAGNEGGYLYIIANQKAQLSSSGGQASSYPLKIQLKMRPHARPIRDLCFYSTNKLLTASDDGLIRLIDLEKQCEEQYFYGHKYGVNSLDLFEKTFVSCSHDRTIRTWNLQQKNSTRVISATNDKPETINSVKFTKDGKYICAAHQSGVIGLYV